MSSSHIRSLMRSPSLLTPGLVVYGSVDRRLCHKYTLADTSYIPYAHNLTRLLVQHLSKNHTHTHTRIALHLRPKTTHQTVWYNSYRVSLSSYFSSSAAPTYRLSLRYGDAHCFVFVQFSKYLIENTGKGGREGATLKSGMPHIMRSCSYTFAHVRFHYAKREHPHKRTPFNTKFQFIWHGWNVQFRLEEFKLLHLWNGVLYGKGRRQWICLYDNACHTSEQGWVCWRVCSMQGAVEKMATTGEGERQCWRITYMLCARCTAFCASTMMPSIKSNFILEYFVNIEKRSWCGGSVGSGRNR